ncbi:MAG: hypothetical protein GX139_00485, partial [Armatimonadetes bacterium]|nr:hypothetical protein [Armatimonadota bacterium]
MKTYNGRLLLILLIVAGLLGLGTGTLAEMSLSSSPTAATANSVWNISAVWSHTDNVWPTLEASGRTEGLINRGRIGSTWSATIGSVRQTIPSAWADTLTWWPALVPPDGFVGFEEPSPVLPGEKFMEIGYVSVQPDPEPVAINPDGTGNPAFEHGVDFVDAEAITAVAEEVPVPDAHGNVPACIVPQQDEAAGGDDDSSRPATPAVIVTEKVPLLLVGVWSSPSKSAASRLKARIRNASAIFPEDDDNAGWPAYNVIEIMETDGKLPAGVNKVYVSYYAPGTNYVITESSPLPMPYTVYSIPIMDNHSPYLLINPGILNLDPNRSYAANEVEGKLNDPQLTPEECPVLGIYGSQNDVMNGENFFDLTDPLDDPANPTAPLKPRYEAPSASNPYGKLYFTHLPDLNRLTEGAQFYVVVSSNAVDGVYDTSGTNYYLHEGKPVGYCSKSGVIRLATPLPETSLEIDPDAKRVIAGQQLFVQYRKLSSRSFTVGQTSSVGVVTSVTPTPGAAGWEFTSKDAQCNLANGRFTIDTKQLPYGTFGAAIGYWANYSGGRVVWLSGNIPMRHHENSPSQGAIFRVAVSAGLNMSNTRQQPYNEPALNQPRTNNRLIYDPRSHPMYYASSLRAGPSGAPAVRQLKNVGRGVRDREIVTFESATISVTVHDSSAAPGMIDHAGVSGNRDWLTIISDVARPSYTDIDPL